MHNLGLKLARSTLAILGLEVTDIFVVLSVEKIVSVLHQNLKFFNTYHDNYSIIFVFWTCDVPFYQCMHAA